MAEIYVSTDVESDGPNPRTALDAQLSRPQPIAPTKPCWTPSAPTSNCCLARPGDPRHDELVGRKHAEAWQAARTEAGVAGNGAAALRCLAEETS